MMYIYLEVAFGYEFFSLLASFVDMQNQNAFRQKCPYSEFFRSTFSRIWTEYGGLPPEKLRIWTLFTQ